MPRGLKYQPLIEHLVIQHEREVALTFTEIETIIGRPLSLAALNMLQSWHATTNLHVRRWQEMGWRARFDRRGQCVHFTRATEEAADETP